MSSETQDFLNSFQSLPDAAQYEAALEILRRTAQWDLEPLSDDSLSQAADELFLELDRREAADGA